MAKCAKCGSELPGDAVFCPECGFSVSAPVVAVAPAQTLFADPSPEVWETVAAGRTLSGLETIPGAPQKQGRELAAGDVFHKRYTIERQLGAGAMGVVYAAKDETSGEAVALKLINPDLADRPTARERLVREGVTARNIRHPAVVGMFDVGETDGQVYLVMEHVQGESLRKWLRRALQERRDVVFETARGIIRSVLEGLAAAHAAGVVHRDLKPENVMLLGDPDAGDYRVKILDFGIARAVGTPSHLTTTSSSTGTPLYMAPEQKTAAETVGPAADLFAVTAMLYEILVGVAPEGSGGAPSRERKDLPPGIDAVVETGLARRPRSRYQSAQEYLQALDAVGRPGEAREPPPPPPPPEPRREPPRREPPPPEPPTGPPPGVPTTSTWDSLVKHSRAQSPWSWALWDRMSKTQRVVFVIVAIVVAGALVGYCEGPSAVGGTGHGVVSPPPPSHMQIAGRWSDEIAGSGVAVGYVDVSQQGQVIGGPMYNMQNYQVGTFEGRVEGTSVEYNYVVANGAAGTGRGRLRSDGIHLDVEVQEHLAGTRERHTLHKFHWPPE